MKVLLVNPPLHSRRGESRYGRRRTVAYPVWLAYAAACLQKRGHQTLLLDADAEYSYPGSFEEIAGNYRPDMLVVNTRVSSGSSDTKTAEQLKKSLGDIFTVLVGSHASARTGELLGAYSTIDAVARREYDSILPEVAHSLENGRLLHTVGGITFRTGRAVHMNPDATLPADLDEIPFASTIYEQFLDVRNYFDPRIQYPLMTLLTSRGCSYGCTFCSSPAFSGRKIRYRSLHNILKEMEFIAGTFPELKSIFFEDEAFTMNRQRCRELCQAMIDRRLKIPWTANCRPDLDLETLKIMKRAGCCSVCAGFESGNQDILNRVRKFLTPSKMRQFAANARKAGILVHGSFIAGLPGETRATLEQTLALAKDLRPDSVQFIPLIMHPDMNFSSLLPRSDAFVENEVFDRFSGEQPDERASYAEEISAAEIIEFCERAHREFYRRPGYLGQTLKRALLRPRESLGMLRGERAFIRFHCRRSLRRPTEKCPGKPS